MRPLIIWLTAAALAAPAAADRFRTVMVGGDTDWARGAGDAGCDVCGHGSVPGGGGGSYRRSYYSSQHSSGTDGGASGFPPSRLGQRRSFRYSSEESEYTFSNGTHSTTITSKRSSDGVPEYHLVVTRLRDRAVIERAVLSQAEYDARRASLGLTDAASAFGFGSTLAASGGRSLLDRLGRRQGSRRGHTFTTFSSEESHYSFSNGTHTTSISGRRNSDGVREYHLELIRDADGAVLDRAVISEAEFNRRRQSMTGGGSGFDGVFEQRGLSAHDSSSHTSSTHGFSSHGTSSHGTSSHGTSSRGTSSRGTSSRGSASQPDCTCVDFSRCEPEGLVGWSMRECPGAQVCCDPAAVRPPLAVAPRPTAPRPTAPPPPPPTSRRTFFRHEEREETRREEASEVCYCAPRLQCAFADRVRGSAALRRCSADEVCCRRPLAPAPTPVVEPAPEPVRGASCSCVPRDACSYRDREFSPEALRRCPRPSVCCRAPGGGLARRPRPDSDLPPADPQFLQQERDMFRDIVQHVDTTESGRRRPVDDDDVRRLQGALSRYDDDREHETSVGSRTEYRQSHTRTESSRGRDFDGDAGLQPVDSGAQTVSSTRRYSYQSSSSHEHGGAGESGFDAAGSRHRDDFGSDDFSQRPLDTTRGETVSSTRRYSYQRSSSSGTTAQDQDAAAAAAGRGSHSRFESSRTHRQDVDSSEFGPRPVDVPTGAQVVSSTRRFSQRRTYTGEEAAPDLTDAAGSGARESHSRFESTRRGGVNSGAFDQEPVDLPGPQTVTSSRRYSYQSSSSSGDVAVPVVAGPAGGAGAGHARFESSHAERREGVNSGPFDLQPTEISGGQTSSRRYTEERTVSGTDAGGLLTGSGHGSGSGSGHLSSSSLGVGHGSGSGSGPLSGSGLGVGHGHGSDSHSSGSRYSSSSSLSSRSESSSGSAGGSHVIPGSYSYRYSSGPSSGSARYHTSSSYRSEQVPVTSSSYHSSYSTSSGRSRHRRGLFSSSEPAYTDPRGSDRCVCVPFYQCEDGNIVTHGADLLDIKLGLRKQCSGFRVCCELPPETRHRLQASPGLQANAMTPVSAAGLDLFDTTHVAERPCVCVSSYLCDGGEIRPSQQKLVDMRQVSRTGRCNYAGQVCCAVPTTQILTTPPPPPCHCVTNDRCRQQDVLTRYHNVNAPTCPGTQVCCSRPLPPRPGYGPSPVVPDTRRPDYDVYRFCKSYPLSIACADSFRFTTLPTIRSSPYFDADADAKRLESAIGYLNADDEVLIDVLTKRTFGERSLIKQAYARLYGKDLYDDITRTTRGKFEDLMQELLEASSYHEYLAKKLHEAMDRVGTDEDTLLESLITSTEEDIAIINTHFHKIEGKTLLEDVEDDLTGDLEDIILALINGTRDASLHVDRQKAKEQALALYRAGGNRLGTEEVTFKYYLTHDNYAQLALVFSEYEQLTGESFEEALEDEFSRHVEDAVLAIVAVTRNVPRYFAGRLHDALWGRGLLSKDDTSLRRIIISRAERDLGTIAREYYQKYGRTLVDDIETKTTGDYEDALVSLVGGHGPAGH